MKIIAVIPARYQSTRLPAKLMQDLGGKTVIRRTYEAALATQLFDEVFVVTDSQLIYDEIKTHSGQVIMSQKNHESGSDRIAEAVENMDVDLVINVQGDEPFINKEPLAQIITAFRDDINKQIDLASLMTPLLQKEEIENPNNVKVVVDQNDFALYFSRSVVPHPRAVDSDYVYNKHIGVYAFRKEALLQFYNWSVSPLEFSEKLEQLRYLENGKRIKMIRTTHIGIGIDTQEDLDKARKLIERK